MATPKKKKDVEYALTLKIGDMLFQGTGTTPQEALASLPKPLKLMHKGVVTVSNGTTSHEILMTPPRLKRLFYNSHGVQQVIAKQLFLGLEK